MSFWRGKRVFVTGHTGFKGAWLCAWLEKLGAEIFGLSLPPEDPRSLCGLIGLEERIGFRHADIRDAEVVRQAVTGFAPEIVLHLAAQSLVRRSYQDPAGTFATNVMGTVNLLEAVRTTPSARAVLIVTSDKCYENREWLWPYREADPLGGADPYSASKAGAELAAQAWRQSFFGIEQPAALATARAGNVIGGGDRAADRLIPDCVAALAAGRAITIRNPNATRPWQHVLDPLAGYLNLAERLHAEGQAYARAWNFGPAAEDGRPVSAVVEAVIRRWGSGGWVAAVGPEPPEAGLLAVDASLARARLGWAPRLGLDAALDWTVDWYRRQHAGEPAAALVAEQVAAYEALA